MEKNIEKVIWKELSSDCLRNEAICRSYTCMSLIYFVSVYTSTTHTHMCKATPAKYTTKISKLQLKTGIWGTVTSATCSSIKAFFSALLKCVAGSSGLYSWSIWNIRAGTHTDHLNISAICQCRHSLYKWTEIYSVIFTHSTTLLTPHRAIIYYY